MSRYTVEAALHPSNRRVVCDGEAVGFAAMSRSRKWYAVTADGDLVCDRTFPTPEAVAAAWGEITGDHK